MYKMYTWKLIMGFGKVWGLCGEHAGRHIQGHANNQLRSLHAGIYTSRGSDAQQGPR
jgi:hypothetical protein